jgi:hypothetical protein
VSAHIDGRVYDEDCRLFFTGRGDEPGDVRLHCFTCAPCRRLWAEAAHDAAVLSGLLVDAPPARVIAELRRALVERGKPAAALQLSEALAWAAIGAVLPAAVAAHLPSAVATLGQVALSLAAASAAFAASAVRQALREAIG